MAGIWLLKSEPSVFSWQDLQAAPQQTTCWEGVRNYQARNFIRDQMQVGDRVLFYHSNANPPAIMGIAEVVKAAYPDHFAWDADSRYFDPKSTPDNPRWFMVDIQYRRDFSPPITLPELRQTPGLEGMLLLQKGCRLSVQPVTEQEWQIILGLRSP
ncbi:EVE domain-containing protein [Thermosynechococcus sp. B0]|uniref:EVE domain-containing protein n=1 Tax=unclassified Thermosynechococcus TaxID=2622553 RepID=UPI00167FE36E|nr:MULTISPECIES: EVE domain-containing protein [unclassified Thermosynechococcus]WJI23945.1 EVE domain-containing protein [Thermosynechococcus sp. B0]WJI26458.1 EVE domain-containing protein [Thermosynechococcus sp. B1]WJI28985.1 EVE domain-containing protein [Thermosynechococcus sp. B3]